MAGINIWANTRTETNQFLDAYDQVFTALIEQDKVQSLISETSGESDEINHEIGQVAKSATDPHESVTEADEEINKPASLSLNLRERLGHFVLFKG